MTEFTLTRQVELPDRLRVARAKNLPNLGPKLLFFSGGSALNDIARTLKHYTHNSTHLVTPFDSGGSSQVLREAFDMPAVGDLRSRLMALADETVFGQPDVFRLFSYRLPNAASKTELAQEFAALVSGDHALMRAVVQPMRGLILSQLQCFAQAKTDGFDLAGASVGNLILTGGYLSHDRALEPVLFLMSKMVEVKGTVRAIVDQNLDLGADLQDGSAVIGQRLLTGKEVAPLQSGIEDLFLCKDGQRLSREAVTLPRRNIAQIEAADLICYAPGSFYSSLLANLLPAGTGRAIARRQGPKIYVPSLGTDPECLGLDLPAQVAALIAALQADFETPQPVHRLLSAVLCDSRTLTPDVASRIETTLGVACLPLPLTLPDTPERYSAAHVCEALVSLV